MFTRYALPLLAALGVAFAITYVSLANKPVPTTLPIADPARAPYAAYVAGAGMVEPSTELMPIGTPVAGVVTSLDHWIGDYVHRGDVLFRIDARDQQATLKVRQASLKSAQAGEAAAKAAADEAGHEFQKVRDLTKEMADPRAISMEEFERREFASDAAQARLFEAQADVASAEAAIDAVDTELERRTIRALVDGRVLQCKVHLGEFADTSRGDLMTLGDDKVLHVRVDVDENDAWRLKTDRPAVAFVRGNRDLSTPLTFVRVEPEVIPKKSLTGDSAERVDTRVLQVIYAFDPKRLPVYVGQQMDVFVEAPPIAPAGPAAADLPASKR